MNNGYIVPRKVVTRNSAAINELLAGIGTARVEPNKGGIYMPVLDLCSFKVVSARGSDSIAFAASLMKRNHVGTILITDETDKRNMPLGIVTDRDLVLRALAENKNLQTKLSEVMSKEMISVRWDDGVREVIEKMRTSGVRRVIVQNSDGKVCGIVSADDLVQLLGDELNLIGDLLRKQNLNEENIYQSTNASSPH